MLDRRNLGDSHGAFYHHYPGYHFKSAFTGLKNIYMYGADGDGSINTGWVQKGTYTVGASSPPVPSVDSVSPNAAAAVVQTFTFVFSDSQSATNLAAAAVLFAPSLSYPNSCFVIYDRNRGTDPAGMGQRLGRR